jgi:hypothetical protein
MFLEIIKTKQEGVSKKPEKSSDVMIPDPRDSWRPRCNEKSNGLLVPALFEAARVPLNGRTLKSVVVSLRDLIAALQRALREGAGRELRDSLQ